MPTDDGDRFKDLIPRMDQARAGYEQALSDRETARDALSAMNGGSDFLDGGRKRAPSERLAMEFDVDRKTALRFMSLARGDIDEARRLFRARTALTDVFENPEVGPLIAYDPRDTGPIPDGLTPFTPFVHSGVSVTPVLARALERRMSGNPPVSRPRVRMLAGAMVDPDRPWMYSPEHRVVIDRRGCVVDGRHLVLAAIDADRVIEMDFWHNMPDDWARIDSRRKRAPRDFLGYPRPGMLGP